MNNRNITALYSYTKSYIDRGINFRTLLKAKEILQNAIDNCCVVSNAFRTKTTNKFIKGFISLINATPKKRNFAVKLQPILDMINHELDCCVTNGFDINI